jgi:GNAT superfamily N-acetyltransferase
MAAFDMTSLRIRKATAEDLETLRAFQQGVVAAERPFDPTLKPGDLEYYNLQALLTDPRVQLVVAEEAGRVVGSGYARIEPAKPYLQHQQYTYLGFMYVDPDYRGRGLNTQILEALRQWTAAQGVTEMRLEVYFENQAARRAYEKFGFSNHMLEMRMPV